MPARHPSQAQAEAVSRRLSLLSAELAAVRDERPEEYDDEPPTRPQPRAWEPETFHTRIRDAGWAEPERDDQLPALPHPGRHASRLDGVTRRLVDQLPDTVRGRAALAPAQLAVVVLVAAVGLVVAAWWVVRSGSSGEAVPAALPPSSVPGLETPGATDSAAATAEASPASVVVDVAGAVRHPGIVVLKAGSRVVDAIEAAGGVRRGVDLSTLNQARVLVDGEQIVVGGPAVPGVAASAAPSSSATGGPTTLVNINTADEAQLETLPGVGPVTAQSIIDWRTENGAFTSVDELLEVDGIGDQTLADLAPYVTI